jgi:hypothetical protein
MNESRNFSEIPAAACLVAGGEFTVTRKNETDKSGSLRMVARSGQPIEHWFWGRVVHDLAGMRLHKPRLPVDYVHDPKEVIGYLNHFSAESGDLVTSGALVPFKDSDRATEIMHKQAQGVPYEASINFGGDGLRVEEVPAGQSVAVNGYDFEGPGIVIREWPLRGVAICPYGADMHTESATFADGETKTYAAAVIPAPSANTKEAPVSESVEVKAEAEEPTPFEELKAEKPVEAVIAEAVAPVAPVPVEATKQAAEEPKAEQPKPEPAKPAAPELPDARKEFARMKADFGAEIAAEIFERGGNYGDALALAHKRAKAEAVSLREQLAAAKANAGQPADFAPVAENKSGVDEKGVARVFRDGTGRRR